MIESGCKPKGEYGSSPSYRTYFPIPPAFRAPPTKKAGCPKAARQDVYDVSRKGGLAPTLPTAAATAVAAVTAVAATTATTATAAATTVATTAATTEARAFFTRAGFVDNEGATADVTAMDATDGGFHTSRVTHGDEGKAARAAGFTVHYDRDFGHGTILGEQIADVRF